jgi:SAM-dependent methyltransferase
MDRAEQAKNQIQARIYNDAIGAPAPKKWSEFALLFTEQGLATRILRKRLGLATPLNTEDRKILEQTIFGHFRLNPLIRTVLFVGCDTYTMHYQSRYFATRNYWTIEPDAARRKFGAKQHVVTTLEELAGHFPADFFDLIICNGVFGWGLNSLDQCERAFAQCYLCLAPNGYLLFGWDDIPQRTPVPLAKITSLARFRKFPFPAFDSWRYLTDTPYRHTFDFYQK